MAINVVSDTETPAFHADTKVRIAVGRAIETTTRECHELIDAGAYYEATKLLTVLKTLQRARWQAKRRVISYED
jgi:hypothetical protein